MKKLDEPGKRTDLFETSTESKESESNNWTAPSLTVFDIGEETLGTIPSGSTAHFL
jgi:hypothetical protein